MSNEGEATDLIAERPDLADALESVLDVDQRNGTWTFDDVPIGSGPFGEFVSRGVVERVDDEYRVADPTAARAALNGDDGVTARNPPNQNFSNVPLDLPEFDRTTTAIVTAAIVLVGLVRAHPIQSIYRDGNVVLSGNDPYAYRYYVEQAVASGAHVFDFSALATLPNGVQKGEPLMVATLWWFAELFGDGATMAGHVLAWYPVVSAVVTAALVYLLTVWVTEDRRVGLAAVLVFALIPGHALRTSVGFADHHAFDYPWLAATALALVALVRNESLALTAPRTWLASVALGVAIAGQTLAWEAGPLLVAAVGLVVVAKAITDVRSGRSPLRQAAPIAAGVGVAAVLTATVHVVVGWHTTQVAFAPALLFVGILGTLAVAEGVHRTTGDARHLALVDVVGAVVGLLVFRVVLPDFWARLQGELDSLFRNGTIAETYGLLDPNSLGFLFLFGFTLFLALPVMVLGVRRALDDDRWLVATTYAWYFFFLATLQVRFVGELAAFAALFAGYALVWLAAWIDAAAPLDDHAERLRVPDRTQLGTLVLLFLLVTSLGIVQVPVKTSQITIEDDTYRSSQFIAERSAELGQEYPENYVLSRWGKSRHYNYFVNGQSSGYGFARQNYEPFLRSADPDDMYDRFKGRVGYVVLSTDLPASDDPTTYRQLTETYGSRTDEVPGVAHYRALYLPPDESKIVYAVVPGANITGNAPANATVTLATDISIPRTEFTYRRQTTASANGTYDVRVSYPGTYRVTVAGETREVTVSGAAVRNGSSVPE